MVTSASRLATALTLESPTVRIKRLIEERQQEIKQTLGQNKAFVLDLGEGEKLTIEPNGHGDTTGA